MQELLRRVLGEVERVETKKKLLVCKKWRNMHNLPCVALWQSLEIVFTVSDFMHLEWIYTIHTLEGFEAFERDLRGASDELKE